MFNQPRSASIPSHVNFCIMPVPSTDIHEASGRKGMCLQLLGPLRPLGAANLIDRKGLAAAGAKMDDWEEGERQNKHGSSVNCNYVQVYLLK